MHAFSTPFKHTPSCVGNIIHNASYAGDVIVKAANRFL